jgi:hypothetical protein
MGEKRRIFVEIAGYDIPDIFKGDVYEIEVKAGGLEEELGEEIERKLAAEIDLIRSTVEFQYRVIEGPLLSVR